MQITYLAGPLGAAAEGGEEGAHVPGNVPIYPYIPEMIFGFVVFAILYFVVRSKVVPTIEKAYAERRAAIEGGIEEAQAAQAQADAAKAEYETQLAGARAEAQQIREDARAQGAGIVEDARQQATAEASRISDTATKQIEAERQAAQVSLRNDVGQLSTALAGKIVGESVEDEVRQRGTVDRFLSELESGELKAEKR